MFLLEIFQYDFMVRALVVGVFTAICTAMLGNFVVSARQAIVSDMLAHTALVGVGLGGFLQVSPSFLAFVSTLVSALMLWWLNRKKNQAPEAISMLLLTGGLAAALLLVHLNKNNPVSLETYLFGSILTITDTEMYLFVGMSLLVIATLLCFWRSFLTLVFDKDFLGIKAHRTFYEIMFMFLIALVVGVGLKVIGGLLIGALLVIPVLIAQPFSRSFKGNNIGSIVVNVMAMIIGILLSFYRDVPASSSIILTLIGFYLLSGLFHFYFKKFFAAA